MKLAALKNDVGTLNVLINKLIKWRLKGSYSHTEIVFEPGDSVEALVPDGNLQPDSNGALWCASSVGTEVMPSWSTYRAGKLGGVRFRRIVLDPKMYDLFSTDNPAIVAAKWMRDNQGRSYDWNLILGYLSWLIPDKKNAVICSEACAEMLGIGDAWRFDPCALVAVVISKEYILGRM